MGLSGSATTMHQWWTRFVGGYRATIPCLRSLLPLLAEDARHSPAKQC